ncbi:fibroblast growth factor 20-like [Diabrotica virgifera virgifera]|nr:fibroblast growth factor 20-like [Diabrotica virgifera virgifera]
MLTCWKHHSNPVKLWCLTECHLTIRPNGEVLGTKDDSDPDTKILRTSAENGLVRLLGINSQLYLCLDHKEEKLYGVKDKNKATLFKEDMSGSYSTYQCTLDSKSWFVGIRNDGKPKPVKTAEATQKETRFLPRG